MNRLVATVGISTLGAIIAFGCGSNASDPIALTDAGTDGNGPPVTPPPAPTFAISGTVTGLAGTGLVLQNNAGDDVVVGPSGTFSFTTRLLDKAAYAVTVKSQPTNPSQVCTVTNGAGAVAGADVTNVAVACVTNKFTVGGTVAGLVGTGLVLQNNAGGDLTVAANGKFTFASPQDDGSNFAVTVKSSPAEQNCVVAGGTGKIASGNVTSVTVNCSTKTYTVGGTITGLEGTGLVLQNNAGDDVAVAANGTFAFSVPLENLASYAVTVKSNPTNKWQTCTVTNGSGAIASAAVTDVAVTCVTNTYAVSGNVTGLQGTDLVLQNNAGDDLSIAADGSFKFNTPVASGAAYVVSVLSQPTNKWQTCTVAMGTGVVGGADVTDVAIACETNQYTVGGTVTGLAASGVVLQNNGGDDITMNADGTFTFATKIPSGSSYSVTVKTKPADRYCAVTKGSGTLTSASITDITVTCTLCGNDCWGADGCMTGGGKCVKFTCRAGQERGDFCQKCTGWKEITYDQWMNGGYCSDIIATYRASNGTETHCGGAATCCGTSAACAGGDNAWHFFDGTNNRYTGPCLGCNGDTNCTFWNGTDNGTYTRITACERQ